MKVNPLHATRRRYDTAFRTEALRLAGESRSTQAAARALNSNPKLLYKWQKEVLTPVAAARGAEVDPATAAELRQLRALARQQAQELDILKKAIASKRFTHVISVTDRRPMSRYRFIEAQRGQYPVCLLCQVLSVPASRYYTWQQVQQQVVEQGGVLLGRGHTPTLGQQNAPQTMQKHL